MCMISRGGLFVKCAALFELKIILLSIFSFAFLFGQLNVVSAQPSTIPIPTATAAAANPGPGSFYTVNVGGQNVIAQWTSRSVVNGVTTQTGTLANGQVVTWANQPGLPNVASTLNTAQIAHWGQTMTWNGQQVAVSDVLGNPAGFSGIGSKV